ncbi:MAG: lipid A deacylase LpxR family protein [Gemmatimonadaceae bacterium]
MSRRPTLVVGVLLLLVPLPMCTIAAAQSPDADRSLRLAVEHDLIALRGGGPPPDYDYTHGTRFAAAWPGAPRWARRLAGGKPPCESVTARDRGCVATILELGQEIYTPRRDAAVPIAGERPYAGWLYASGIARAISPRRVRSVQLTLGVTGRPSLAADVQNALHRVLSNERQLGWAHQLAFEPGIAIRYDDRLTRERAFDGARAGRLGLSWGATVGNVRTALHVGADARLGLRGMLPWVPAEPEIDRPMRLYVLTGYRQDVVLRDLFVEGNTLRASSGAERRTIVGQYELGIGVRRRAYTIEYRHVSRGREYRAQPGSHAYGVLALVLHEY